MKRKSTIKNSFVAHSLGIEVKKYMINLDHYRIIGDKKTFAVEYSVDAIVDQYIYGKFCYWIDQKRVGEYTASTTVSDMLWDITRFVKDNGKRIHKRFFNMSIEKLMVEFIDAVNQLGLDDYEKVANEEEWDRFNIVSKIDIFYEWRVYLFDYHDLARIIVVHEDELSQDFKLMSGIVDGVLKELYLDLNQIYEEYILDETM